MGDGKDDGWICKVCTARNLSVEEHPVCEVCAASPAGRMEQFPPSPPEPGPSLAAPADPGQAVDVAPASSPAGEYGRAFDLDIAEAKIGGPPGADEVKGVGKQPPVAPAEVVAPAEPPVAPVEPPVAPAEPPVDAPVPCADPGKGKRCPNGCRRSRKDGKCYRPAAGKGRSGAKAAKRRTRKSRFKLKAGVAKTTQEARYPFLYPTLDDTAFNARIARRKEFYDTR